MENKTKVKVAVVIGIVILAVIFIFMVVFVKGNRPKKNPNIPTITNGYAETNKNIIVDSGSEDKPASTPTPTISKDTVSLAVKSGSLVKINSDLTDSEIMKLESGYSEFCYGENKAYVVFNNEDRSCSVFEVDLLKSDYPQKLIFNTKDYGFISNINYYVGKLYFVSQIGQLIEYSIAEEYSRALTNENEVSSFAVDKTKNSLYVAYKPNSADAGIYMLDFTANVFNQIISSGEELPKQVILNGKSLVIHIASDLYVYNTETNSVVDIGSGSSLTKSKDHIAFYDNVLLYTDGASISLKDASGNNYKDSWYTLNDRTIASISMIDSKTLQVARYGIGSSVQTRSILIDLSNGAATEKPETVYTDIVRIK